MTKEQAFDKYWAEKTDYDPNIDPSTYTGESLRIYRNAKNAFFVGWDEGWMERKNKQPEPSCGRNDNHKAHDISQLSTSRYCYGKS